MHVRVCVCLVSLCTYMCVISLYIYACLCVSEGVFSVCVYMCVSEGVFGVCVCISMCV